jgi:type II secretion system protein I
MNARGFTLIEVLITLVILSVSIVAVLRSFGAAATALGTVRDSLWSSLLAREKLTAAAIAAEENGGAGFATSSGRIPAAGMEYGWTLRVQPVERLPADAGAGRPDPVVLNEAEVTLWRSGSARERVVTTYVTSGRQRDEKELK